MHATEAVEKYQKVSAETIPPDLLVPEIRVIAWPHPLEEAPDIASVRAIVLMPKDSRDRSQAISPSQMTESVTNYSNLFGATWQGAGAVAVFRIADFVEGREVRVVFDKRIQVVGVRRCDDCGIEIKLSKVK